MAFQSLYRRFRPQRFVDVRGQDHVSHTLRNAVRDGRVAHAYLFSGPRGTGKTSSARILAKALNCANPDLGEPCGVCTSCVEIAEGRSLDVMELDAASNRGVDAMRELVSRASLGTPGRWKVYIVDEVHMLTTEASNTLLKTLEEPPAHVIFVLATTEPQKVLPTIRSRTQHFEFHLLSVDMLVDHLRWVADQAGLDIPDELIRLVAKRGAGSARDALSKLDQVAAAGGIDDAGPSTDEVVEALCERDVGRALVAVAERVERRPRPAAAGGRAARAPPPGVPGHRRPGAGGSARRRGGPHGEPGVPDGAGGDRPGDGGVGRRADRDARRARHEGVAGGVAGAAVPARGRRLARGHAGAHRTPGAASGVRPVGPDPGGDDWPFWRRSRCDATHTVRRRRGRWRRPVLCRRPGSDADPDASAARTGASAAPTRIGGVGRIGGIDCFPRRSSRSRASGGGRPVGSRRRPRPVRSRPGQRSSCRSDRPTASARPVHSVPAHPLPIRSRFTPAAAAAFPSRDDLTMAWGDVILPNLPPKPRARFRAGRFVDVAEPGHAGFALPTPIHRERCAEVQGDVEHALSAHFGRRVPLKLLVETEVGAPPGPRAGRRGAHRPPRPT